MRIRRHKGFGAAAPLIVLLALAPVGLALQGCTDLEKAPLSFTTPENFYQNEAEVLAALAAVYAQLRAVPFNYWTVSEISTDEVIVPTRGADWFDNGRWLEIHRQTWGPNTPSGLSDINGVWVQAFTGITRANQLLEALAPEDVTIPNKAAVIAELRTLRGFYYYWLMDLFGGVPIVTDIKLEARPRASRREVFDFIVTELTAARNDLPLQWPADQHGRMTQGAADAILASMALNAGVWARDNVNPTGYNSCTAVQVGGVNACEAAVAAADRVINSGVYSLATNWNSNFTYDNHTSRENILVVKHLNQDGLGFVMIMTTLHYHQFSPSPWNGFSTLAETFNAFDSDDLRKNIFLVGCQNDFFTGAPLTDRTGQPLCFTPEIQDATQANEREGVRIWKWPFDPNHVGPNNSNDFAYFRLAEMYLIKAEAALELGRSAEALGLINLLRQRVFEPDEPLGSVNRDTILRERLFELTFELKRRQDLIRHGKFTQAWSFKAPSEPHRILMPIPQSQLDANPMLTQNPGY